DPQIVDKVEAAERFRQLKAAREPSPRAPVGRHAVDLLAVEQNIAAVVMQCPGKAVDERALAGAVGPDQAKPFAGSDGHVDMVARDKAAKALAEPRDFEDRRRHRRNLARIQPCTSPTMPLGAITTNTISSTPTISRFSADEIVTVASCWIVPS